MSNITLTPELIARLKKLAESECWADNEDLIVDDYAGGNIDDAYYGGETAGEVQLARSILDELGIEWEIQQ